VVPFRPIEGRARWAVIALVAIIVVDVISIGSDLLEIRLMDRLIDGDESALDGLEGDDIRQGIVALLYLAGTITAAVFFIRWFHRAYENLDGLGAATVRRYGTGWAIGSWFVPFLNLWRPKQIANDIWKGSDPQRTATELTIATSPQRRPGEQATSPPALLNVWWAAWIVTAVVGTALLQAVFDAPTAVDAGESFLFVRDTSGLHEIRTAATMDAIASAIDVVAGVLALLVIRMLTTRQVERARFLALAATETGTVHGGTMA